MRKSVLLFLAVITLVIFPLRSALGANDHVFVPVTETGSDIGYPVYINSNMLYIEDPDHSENITTILNNTQHWQAINRQSPNFGFTTTAFWFKFIIRNKESSEQTTYIELPIPFLDDVQLYRTHNNIVLEKVLVGDHRPFSDRPILHPSLVMPFKLAPGDNHMIMRIASEGSVEGSLTLWSPDAFALASSDEQLLQGIWLGIVGIMVIYNLFLFFAIRDTSYLFYVGFAFGYLFFHICLKGYGYAYLWTDLIKWNSFALATFIALCNLSAAMLVIKYLKLKKNMPLGYRIMSIVATTSGILLLLTFVAPYSITIRIVSSLTFFTCFLSLTYGYTAWFRGDQYAKFYCLAWTAAFVGVVVQGAAKFGIVPSNFWTNNAGQIGVMMLVALLSFALANRVNREKELRIEAQESSLQHEKLARISQEELLQTKMYTNEKLERQVTERTLTLQKALMELEGANSRLEILSTTDALTSLFNRGHFETRLNLEFNRATRHERELCVILCDIDFFKTINDSYGHKAGDAYLRETARVLKNRINRSGDIIARYGGEEFIILLVDTPLTEAEKLAIVLCEEISAIKIGSYPQEISTTASFGVASLLQSDAKSSEELVHKADVALYQAKNAGRNQVAIWQADT